MYCPECGTRLDDDALFCPECGTKVRHDAEPPAAGTSPEPQREQQQPERDEPQSSPTPQEQPDTRAVFARGLILTNIATLSQRL